MRLFYWTPILVLCSVALSAIAQPIPSLNAPALDGHFVALPRDLPAATILIVGFSRHSESETTTWEKQVRTTLPHTNYYDMAFIADAPAFVRPMITKLIRNKVPDFVHPHFLVLSADEGAWKNICEYDRAAPDAAYVLLVDHTGNVIWKSHAAYSADSLSTLRLKADALTQR